MAKYAQSYGAPSVQERVHAYKPLDTLSLRQPEVEKAETKRYFWLF